MIDCSVTVEASSQVVFDVSQNYDERMQWDPFPDSYEFLNGTTVEKGLQVLVKAKNGHSMVVEYISFNPPHATAVKMIQGPWFIREFAGSWNFRDIADNKCEVSFKYYAKGNPRFLGFIVTPILESVFKKHARRRLNALAEYVQNEKMIDS